MLYLEELKKLNFPEDKFSVFGSGNLAIRKIRENKDIDIIVKKDLWNDLIKKFPTLNEIGNIEIGNIEVAHKVPYLEDIDFLINSSDVFEGVRFVKLEKVLEWKQKMNREKDKKDVILIKEYLSKN